MIRTSAFLLALGALVAHPAAQASTKSKGRKQSQKESSVIRVPVAQPETHGAMENSSDQVGSAQAAPQFVGNVSAIDSETSDNSVTDLNQLEVAISDWNPNRFDLVSRVGSTSSFSRTRMPALWLGWVSAPWLSKGTVSLSARAGVGLTILERKSESQLAGSFSGSQAQSLYAFPVKLGVELKSPLIDWHGIGPFAQASLVPTMAITTNSPLSSGETLLGLPWELSAGLSAELFEVAALNLAWIQTFGSVGGGSVSGGGVQASVRIGI